MNSLFLSYSSNDTERIKTLVTELEDSEISYWIDHSGILIGDLAPNELREAIHNSSACVFCVTRSSLKSKWCYAEISAFWALEKKIYPLILDSDIQRDELPAFIKELRLAYSSYELISHLKIEIPESGWAFFKGFWVLEEVETKKKDLIAVYTAGRRLKWTQFGKNNEPYAESERLIIEKNESVTGYYRYINFFISKGRRGIAVGDVFHSEPEDLFLNQHLLRKQTSRAVPNRYLGWVLDLNVTPPIVKEERGWRVHEKEIAAARQSCNKKIGDSWVDLILDKYGTHD